MLAQVIHAQSRSLTKALPTTSALQLIGTRCGLVLLTVGATAQRRARHRRRLVQPLALQGLALALYTHCRSLTKASSITSALLLIGTLRRGMVFLMVGAAAQRRTRYRRRLAQPIALQLLALAVHTHSRSLAKALSNPSAPQLIGTVRRGVVAYHQCTSIDRNAAWFSTSNSWDVCATPCPRSPQDCGTIGAADVGTGHACTFPLTYERR